MAVFDTKQQAYKTIQTHCSIHQHMAERACWMIILSMVALLSFSNSFSSSSFLANLARDRDTVSSRWWSGSEVAW